MNQKKDYEKTKNELLDIQEGRACLENDLGTLLRIKNYRVEELAFLTQRHLVNKKLEHANKVIHYFKWGHTFVFYLSLLICPLTGFLGYCYPLDIRFDFWGKERHVPAYLSYFLFFVCMTNLFVWADVVFFVRKMFGFDEIELYDLQESKLIQASIKESFFIYFDFPSKEKEKDVVWVKHTRVAQLIGSTSKRLAFDLNFIESTLIERKAIVKKRKETGIFYMLFLTEKGKMSTMGYTLKVRKNEWSEI